MKIKNSACPLSFFYLILFESIDQFIEIQTAG
jgi:hypothetical protein